MVKSYLQTVNGIKKFSGNPEIAKVLLTTTQMASNCLEFQMDVEDEIIYENKTTCYNCRYRRWELQGFTCFKDFPLNNTIV